MTLTRRARAARCLVVQDERGFTLIELMVVILIFGILAAIATPIFLGAVDQARTAAVQAELTSARLDLATVLVTDGEFVGLPVEGVVIDTYGDPNVTLTLWASGTEFCVIGEHANLSETWAASRVSAPVEGAGCASDATIVLP